MSAMSPGIKANATNQRYLKPEALPLFRVSPRARGVTETSTSVVVVFVGKPSRAASPSCIGVGLHQSAVFVGVVLGNATPCGARVHPRA